MGAVDRSERPVLAVTGASGYIGSRVVDEALHRGYAVVALGRTPLKRSGVVDRPFELRLAAVDPLPPETKGLIHLAADTSGRSAEAEVAALAALAGALPSTARLVFVSSQTARADAPSPYGRAKWRLEAAVAEAGGLSVRPGLVYGGSERGLFGSLCGAARRLPLLPLFLLPRPAVQPIHVDDLATGLLKAVELPEPVSGPLRLAGDPMPFDRFLAALTRHRLRRPRPFVPVPIPPLVAGLALVERMTGRLLGSEQLRSLAGYPAMDTSADLARLGLVLRPLEAGLRQRGASGRRALIEEGARLISYLGRLRAPAGLIRRYARILEEQRAAPVLKPGAWAGLASASLYLLDRGRARDPVEQTLLQRLDLALRLYEASPASAARCLGAPGRRRPLSALTVLATRVIQEALIRLVRPVGARFAARLILVRATVSDAG
jgi:uncharacterized protein YbjT (DUF2867 family)